VELENHSTNLLANVNASHQYLDVELRDGVQKHVNVNVKNQCQQKVVLHKHGMMINASVNVHHQ
jgi:hypothetical protein